MIDFNLIDKSIKFYETNGFVRIEAPWTVTKDVSDITKPADRKDFTIKEKDKVLVGSGEQSFLYLILKGFLAPGKYQTVTPCFRDESFDLTHTKYFIKNELIITNNTSQAALDNLVKCAKEFFSTIVPDKKLLEVIKLGAARYDIEYDGIELGSYGIRDTQFTKYIYGTGIAEPRTTTAINRWNHGVPRK